MSELERIQGFVDDRLRGKERLRVLDAGCGGKMYVALPSSAHITGIDISEESARRNRLITDVIIDDVQRHKFPPKSFDVILCWDVLEHLPQPDLALKSFFEAVKDDGIIILGFPNVWSLKGLVTKFTPHQAHVWILRTFMGHINAGRPGFAPFPTFLRMTIAPRSLLRLCKAYEMAPIYLRVYAGSTIEKLRQGSPVAHRIYQALIKLLNLLSLNTHDFGLTDVRIIIARAPKIAGSAN